MRAEMRRRVVALIVVLVTLAVGCFIARPYVHGLSFVIRAADMHGVMRQMAEWDTHPERERLLTIPTARGPLRARLYQPVGSHRRAALAVSGLHSSGIDEPRLMRLARQLAASGVAVVTPDIPELSRFEITPAITDAIERAAGWLANESGLAADHRVGMMGISFSGGLSVVAAGRPSLGGHVAYAFAFGGHDDLPRVLRYLCTGVEPPPVHELQIRLKSDAGTDPSGAAQGATRPPHDYGVAVILLGVAERVVPRPQVEPLRSAVRRFLQASALDTVDKRRAEREFAALKDLARTLPEPSRTLLRYVNERDVVHLGARLLSYVGSYGGDPALSASKSPKPSAPVFLLHGTDDNVIPAIESEYLAEDLRGHAPVKFLLSGLITHAEADRPARVGDVMKLASFWGDLLSR